MQSSLFTLYATASGRDEAIRIARRLVEEDLVACVNVLPGVVSVYEWEGETHEDSEVVLIGKTTAERVDAAMQRIVELHSYECPCVTAWPVDRAHPPYAEWVRGSVGGG